MSPTSRTKSLLPIIGVIVAALALIGVTFLWGDRETVGDNLAIVEEDLNTAMDGMAEQQAVIDQLTDGYETLRDQLLKEGVEPDAPPPSEVIEDLPDVIRPTGEPIPPTDEQVQAAVTVVLDENPTFLTSQVIAEVSRQLAANPPEQGPQGEQGGQGEPGANATDAQVFSAVVTFCAGPDEPCKGDDGAAGADAVLTQDMVDTALVDFCSTNPDACQSDVPGPEGPKGDPGRGLVAFACIEGKLVATYDQAPITQTIEGSSCQFPPKSGGRP
jgi:hypothetical protein